MNFKCESCGKELGDFSVFRIDDVIYCYKCFCKYSDVYRIDEPVSILNIIISKIKGLF